MLPACLPMPACLSVSFSATTASRTLQSACAVLNLLGRVYVWGPSQCATHFNNLRTPSNILRTLSNILRAPSNILGTLSNFLLILSNI